MSVNMDIVYVSIAAIILVMCAIVVLFGRGDWLLSGYNTASREKREKYNIVRLRAVTGIGLILLAAEIVVMEFVSFGNENVEATILCVTALLLSLLSMTYCKR